ncbi:hypothetical protein [Marinobacter sp. CHS3-4]|uniref:hypothetical protein n=1 Tax=Marinobacter sp. CHS3-4 TaxID=3045174 RepID=UPI0024B5988D|nr:hypothetical protein [Marinobacter sp. CHS3-4]MDI9244725.1 hypothetical protein [Marinobacter sp. CHS3-4]
MFKFIASAIGLTMLILAGPVWAQQTWCGNQSPAEDHPLAWPTLKPGFSPLIQEKDYEGAYRYVLGEYRSAFGSQDPELMDGLQQKAMTYLQRRKTEGELPSEWDTVFSPSRNAELLILDGRAPRIHQVSCDSPAWDNPESPAVAVFYLASAMNRLASDTIRQAQILAAREADQARRSYEDWLFNGFAMWPWEMKLNELRIEKDFLSPAPEWQFTALRPSVALAVRSDSFNRSQLDHALVIEPIGYVRYLDGSRHQDWWGVSPIVTVTSENGGGYGMLARYNQFTLGAAHHESVDEVLVYFSVDLYQYLLTQEEKLRRAKTFFGGD